MTTMFSRCLTRHRALLALLCVCCSTTVAQAETASTQAMMTLIVLPNDTNRASIQTATAENTSYNGDTTDSTLQRFGTRTYQVWVAI